MTKISNNPKITNEELVNVNRSAIEHRATWMGLIYMEAVKAGADAEKITRAAVAKTGGQHGAGFKAKMKTPGKIEEFADVFLAPLGIKTFEMDVKTKNKDALEIQFHYCPLVAGWLKAGIPKEEISKLCDIAMDGDRNIAKTVGADFKLGKTIAAGDAVCEVNFYKKK
jgi:hypothetical protein